MMKSIRSYLAIGCLCFLFCYTLQVHPAVEQKDDIDFTARLQFYVDMKTKRFLQRMSTKEAFLLQMIHNITEEVKARGKKRLKEDSVAFEIVYGERDQLVETYSKEIDAIISIIKDLDRLELLLNKGDDLKLLNEVDELKDSLLVTLETSKLDPKYLTKPQLASMIDEYSREVNTLLRIYEQIEQFERKAVAQNDAQTVNELKEQKKRIVQALEISRISNPFGDNVVREYISEADNIMKILKELDLLEAEVEFDTTKSGYDIEAIRKNLIKNIDERILRLFGYTSQTELKGPTLSDFFKEWKAQRVAEVQVKLTQHRILRDQLIKTSNEEELKRMIERDRNDGLLNYTDAKYDLAIMQLNELYKIYEPYYNNLDGILFYAAEANYAKNYFNSAFNDFTRLVEKFPNSPYLAKAFSRMILISNTYGWYDKVLDYYEKLKLQSNATSGELDQSHYLVGYIYFNQRKYVDANKVLEAIADGSRYYLAAKLLSGIVYTNIDNYSKAKQIFESLINTKNYPWTDIDNAIIRNEALLKLGYLHYQRGEYDQAIVFFEQVSEGYDRHDSSVMGVAWAKLKKGQYQATVDQINLLTSKYVLSNYTYEGMVLAAHCKEIQNETDEALKDLRYVSYAKEVLDKAKDYNEEREHLVLQLNELERLEEQIFERQDQRLYPKVMKIRDNINNALSSFYYRGSISSLVVEEYNDERKIVLQQIKEFDNIVNFAQAENNKELLLEAQTQRERLLMVLESYAIDESGSNANYFVDYPLAIKEQGYIYQRDIIVTVVNDLIAEKRRVELDLEMITKLLETSSSEMKMEAIMDLEILEEDLKDLHNQLDRFQVWIANHQIEDINTDAEQWADFSGYGISDINFTAYYEKTQKVNTMAQNISHIDDILKKKKELLERKINRFDNEVLKIQKELESEKIRLEKLEKEKYFRDIYFDTKTREVEEDGDIDIFLESNQ